MSDLETQRNVAIGVAAVAVAFVAGYVLSSGPRSGGDVPSESGASRTAAAAFAEAVPVEPETRSAQAEPTAATTSGAVAQRDESARPRQVPERRRAAEATPGLAVEPAAEAEERSAAIDGELDALEERASRELPTEPVRRLVAVTVPQSTPVTLDLLAAVSSETAQLGDRVVAELAEPLRVDGAVVVPAGARVTGRVSEAQALKKVGGKAILALTFDRLESGDGGVAIAAAFRREGKSETAKDAATIAAGAAIGTILGNQAKKNDRGKLIGVVVGAAAGTAVAAKTQGETIELPAGARLELALQQDVEVLVDR